MGYKGKNWGTELSTFTDATTGVEITKLTSYKAHHHHLYFTNPGWFDNASKIVISGERENVANLFSLCLQSGEIIQLTDLNPIAGKEFNLLNTCLNHVLDEVCYWYNGSLWATSLKTYEMRRLWTLPPKQNLGMPNVTSDGKFILFCMTEDATDRLNLNLDYGYVGFDEYFALKPLSQIVRIPTDGSGDADILLSQNVWLSHLNTSPTMPNHITFCHEGPWHKIENRIWAMDISSGKFQPLRQRRSPDEIIGHEYWFACGTRIGYHGHLDSKNFLGSMKFDGTDIVEGEFPNDTVHVHSNNRDLAVGDGKHDVLLWKWNATGYDNPRILCRHSSSMHIQATHVHPRISPCGSYVIYVSDANGYGAPYIAKLPADVASLPFA